MRDRKSRFGCRSTVEHTTFGEPRVLPRHYVQHVTSWT
jgi:hypothetical protein